MKNHYLVIFLLLISLTASKAQVVITSPTYLFDYLCQSSGVNTNHELKFSVSPISGLSPGNTFEILVSNDNFNTNIVLIPTNTTIAGSQVTLNFTLPTNIYGENFRFKVRSSAPSQTSATSVAPGIGLYFLSHNQEIMLNAAGGISSAVFCNGNSFELIIFNSGTNSSPLFYPALTYKWYRVSGSNDILVGSGTSLTVNQAGQYYVVTDYGECTPSSFSKSRKVTITGVSAGSYVISSTSGNTICEGNIETLSLNISDPTGFTFQWFLDDIAIPGATSPTHQTSVGGIFKVIVNNGSCEGVTAPFTLSPITFTASVTPTSPTTIVSGQTIPITVTTNAASPTFQWFLDGVALPETSNTLIASQIGDYKVIVNQTAGCASAQEFNVVLQKPGIEDIPNLISPNGDGINDTWELPNRILNLQNVTVEIINSKGKKVLSETNYTNNWPQAKDDFTNANAVFYYIISQDNNVLHQGSLTVIF